MTSYFYDFTPTDITGKPFPFSELKGKVVLVVNVATKCGFSPQYEGLEALYKEYKDRGLVILGFPCNQFLSQEPGSDAEIAKFCETKYGVTFPMMKKIDVNGEQTHPVYQWLKSQKSGLLGLARIKWNFVKFLVDKEGNVAGRFSSTRKPDDLKKEIERLL